MILQPATLTVLIVAIGLGLLGLILLRAALRSKGRACPAPGCGFINPPEARFCGHCGAELTPPPQGPSR